MESTPLFSMGQQKLWLQGPAGVLEALLSPVPDEATPRRAVLICHPHPLFGGTMHNKVLYRIARRLPVEAGAMALRFNFRGVGAREGSHDEGRGEVEDARAGLGLPLSLDLDLSPLHEIEVPLLLVQGEKDEFADEPAVRSFAEGLSQPPRLFFVAGAGHLFQGAEEQAVDAVIDFLGQN